MTKEEYILQIRNTVTDEWGFVKPQPNWQNSGNGVFYTAVDVVIRDKYGIEQRSDFAYLTNSCINDKNVLMRTPDNAYGQEQWDNYLGVATACIVLKLYDIPAKLFKSGLKKFFFMDTDNKKEAKDFLGRFPHVWALMLVAAVPSFKYLCWPLLALYHKFFMNPTKTDGSGNNLQFMYAYAMGKLYGDKYLNTWLEKLKKEDVTLGDNFKVYLSPDHPITKLQIEMENQNLTT